MTRGLGRRAVILLAVGAAVVAGWMALASTSTPNASAHPLGNFTVNRYSRLELYSDAILVRYVVDMAEIPALQEIVDIDTDGDGELSARESNAYLSATAADLSKQLTLTVDGRRSGLAVVSKEVSYPEGQAGLDTLRMALWLRSEHAGANGPIEYRDPNYADRIGWREIVVEPMGGTLLGDSDVLTEDISQELRSYPDDQLTSPLNISRVTFSYDTSSARPAPDVGDLRVASAVVLESTAQRPQSAFVSLIDVERVTLPVILIAVIAAFAFGAIHALEPGHGKTIVAAYFVGIRGTAGQAIALGLIIAATHTLGVLAIGAITLFGSQYILPEDLYPWLSLIAGVMVLALGLRLALTRLRSFGLLQGLLRRFAHHHHDHHYLPTQDNDSSPPWRSLIALGLADGLVPSPSTLVVLLAAVSLDRIGLGLALVIAFSVGLAAVLTAVSLGLVYARRLADWLSSTRAARARADGALARLANLASNERLTATYLPIAGSVALIGVGALLTIRALPDAGLLTLF